MSICLFVVGVIVLGLGILLRGTKEGMKIFLSGVALVILAVAPVRSLSRLQVNWRGLDVSFAGQRAGYDQEASAHNALQGVSGIVKTDNGQFEKTAITPGALGFYRTVFLALSVIVFHGPTPSTSLPSYRSPPDRHSSKPPVVLDCR